MIRILLAWMIVMGGLQACTPGGASRERTALMQADREFARQTAQRGVEGWVTNFAEEGVMFRSGGTVQGREAIREFMAPVFADETFSLTWEPGEAHVAGSGDLGYTVGRYESRLAGSDGTEQRSTGSYTTIWRRQLDGTWKVVLDIGTED